MKEVMLIAAAVVMLVSVVLHYWLDRSIKRDRAVLWQISRQLVKGLVCGAVKCGATRIRLGLPDDGKPQIRYRTPSDCHEASDEIEKKLDKIAEDLMPPTVTLAETKSIPIWFECEEEWREQVAISCHSYGGFYEGLFDSFNSIPGSEGSSPREYIEVDWDDRQKIYVRCRIRIEPDYHISLEILDWTQAK